MSQNKTASFTNTINLRKLIRDYIKLLRPKHWIKNGLIFATLIFSGRLIHIPDLLKTILGVIVFCLVSSVVYIINDIRDRDADKNHEIKCNRPIASGGVTVAMAWVFAAFISAFAAALIIVIGGRLEAILLIVLYFILNILYSFGLKRIPLVDIAILVSGFLFRVMYGGMLINEQISAWLYLTVIAFSFYLGLGKRRNELIKAGDKAEHIRGVLKHYNKDFLDKNMYMCLGLTLVFYSLWSVDAMTVERVGGIYLIWTVPLVLLICMKYSLNIETGAYADPVDVLMSDKVLQGMILLFGVTMGIMLYLV